MDKKNLTTEETFALAVQNQQKNNLQVAENLYKETLKTNPNHVDAHNNLGIIFKELGELQKAVDCYQKVIQIQPEDAYAHYNLGLVFKELGELQKAVDCFQKVIQIQPDRVDDAHVGLGLVFKELEEYQKAKSCYEKAIQINPYYAEAHNNLGVVFIKLGEDQKAMSCYEKAIEIDPNYAGAYYNLGVAFNELGEGQKAMSCYEKAIEIDPNYADAYYNLGSILVILKKFNEAIKIYQQALRLKPGDKFISHVLSALFGNTTKTAPKEYVVKLFDDFANSFDKQLTEKLKYRVPEKLVALLKKTTSKRLNFKHAIDVGCGTGLSGSAFRPLTDYLVGIDISKKMIEKASDKNIYDYVEQGDISTYLTKCLKKFDLFISTDVFIYVGDLDEVFSKVSAKSNLNAKFCFSVEKCEDNEFKLLKSVRYAHSKEYIDRLSKRYKFIIESFEETEIRTEFNTPLTGYIFILKKI